MMRGAWFRAAAALTAVAGFTLGVVAGFTLGEGLTYGRPDMAAAGAVLSAVFPWGLIGVSAYRRGRADGR